MAEVKENSTFTRKFVNEDHFAELHKTFLAAFAGYRKQIKIKHHDKKEKEII